MKEEKENKIDYYFQEGLNNLNIIPPIEVWDNIAERLPKKGNRKMFLWVAVAASVTLLAAISGWYYLQRGTNTMNQTQQIVANTSKQQKIGSSHNHASVSASKEAKQKTIGITKARIATNITKRKINTYQIESEVRTSAQENTAKKAIEIVVITSPTNQSVTSKNDEFSFISSISLTHFNVPDVYGSVNDVPSVAKVDTTPVYDNIFAYEDISEAKTIKNRWAIGGQMAPLYSYRNISEINTPGLSKSSMNEIEDAIISYASGVLVDYEATSRLTFQTGIYYMKMGQEINNVSNFTKTISKAAYLNNSAKDFVNSSITNPAIANSTGTIVAGSDNLYVEGTVTSGFQEYALGNLPLQPADGSDRKNIEQSFEFLEVPFIAKYKIINRKINVHLLGGLSTHVLVNNRAKITYSDNTTVNGSTSNVETFNYSSSVGFGVVYNLRKNMFFSVEPTFKYYLNSFNSTDVVKLHPYAFGLYSGLSFKF